MYQSAYEIIDLHYAENQHSQAYDSRLGDSYTFTWAIIDDTLLQLNVACME